MASQVERRIAEQEISDAARDVLKINWVVNDVSNNPHLDPCRGVRSSNEAYNPVNSINRLPVRTGTSVFNAFRNSDAKKTAQGTTVGELPIESITEDNQRRSTAAVREAVTSPINKEVINDSSVPAEKPNEGSSSSIQPLQQRVTPSRTGISVAKGPVYGNFTESPQELPTNQKNIKNANIPRPQQMETPRGFITSGSPPDFTSQYNQDTGRKRTWRDINRVRDLVRFIRSNEYNKLPTNEKQEAVEKAKRMKGREMKVVEKNTGTSTNWRSMSDEDLHKFVMGENTGFSRLSNDEQTAAQQKLSSSPGLLERINRNIDSIPTSAKKTLRKLPQLKPRKIPTPEINKQASNILNTTRRRNSYSSTNSGNGIAVVEQNDVIKYQQGGSRHTKRRANRRTRFRR